MYPDIVFSFFTEIKLFLYYREAAHRAFKSILHPVCAKPVTLQIYLVYKIGLIKYLKSFNATLFLSHRFFNDFLNDNGKTEGWQLMRTRFARKTDLTKFFVNEFYALGNIYQKFLKVSLC